MPVVAEPRSQNLLSRSANLTMSKPAPKRRASTLPTTLQKLVAATATEQTNRERTEREEGERRAREDRVRNAIGRLESCRGDLRGELRREPTDEECAARIQENICELREALRQGNYTTFWDSVSVHDSESVLVILRELPENAIAASLLELHATPAGQEAFARLWQSINFGLSFWWNAYLHPPTPEPSERSDQDGILTPSVDDLDLTILRCLANFSPRRCGLEDLAAAADASRKTVGKRITNLISRGYVIRPEGLRNGVTITDPGRTVLAEDTQGTR